VSAFRRILAALLLVGVLADASACIVAFTRADEPAEQNAMSALCPCGCKAHTGALAGIGITQLAAPPAEGILPDGPRVAPEPAVLSRPSLVPVRKIDHVPLLLA
jgi:hypothetical protein